MSTIRQRLTWRLLLGWTLLLVTGLGITYWSTRAALTRQFDDGLLAKAMALTTLTEQNSGRIEIEFADEFMREFDTEVSTAFFQVWRTDGSEVERSKSLHGASLPLHYGTLQAPLFWSLDLPAGLAGRAVGLKFQPHTADDGTTPAAAVGAILVVATDRRELDHTFATLGLVLASCGVLILALTATAVPLLLRLELAPLERLADQAQRITAESFSARFATAGLPGELASITARLNDLLQRLQTAFERERQFSDDLAHEFRTPIAELRSLAELSLKWPDTRSADTDQSVRAIALQMESIINRLLAIARGEQGQVPVTLERVEVTALLAAVCHPLQEKAAARQLAIEVNAPASLEIHSDPVLLRSIVTNLVDNAVEYAPAHGTVRIESDAQNGGFLLRVTNPVEHLSAEDVPHLFDRFWRKDAARSHAEHSGLGLSLARAYAASLGYRLTAALNGDACLALTLSGPLKLEQPGQSIFTLEKPT
jgi:two-component system sensor histidine kinase QseC